MGGGQSYTASGATYDGATGVCVITIGTHSLVVGDNIEIAQDSMRFTCATDSNATNHDYPRSTDPARTKVFVKIIAITTQSITVNVGISSDTSQHTFVSCVADAINSSGSAKPTIKNNSTTQHLSLIHI